MSEDHSTLYVNDEIDELCQSGLVEVLCSDLNNVAFPNTRIFDISSLNNIEEPREFINMKAHPSIDHNIYVEDDYAYSANYQAGA